MEFVLSTDPADAPRLSALVPGAVLVASGPWGCVAATASRYFGLNPVVTDDAICLVLADPMIRFDARPETEAAAPNGEAASNAEIRRTAEILRAVQSGVKLPNPVHAGCVIVVQKSGGLAPRISGITDASGFAAPYYWCGDSGGEGREIILASSPDMIAGLRPVRLDTLSVCQFLASRLVTAPYTLYEGIEEVGPGVRFRLHGEKLEQVRWWTAPKVHEDMVLADAVSALERGIHGFGQNIAGLLGRQGWVTLSAGMDSRFMTVMLRRILDLQAVGTGLARSANVWAAGKAAAAIGLPYRFVERRPDHYSRVVLEATATWPSHQPMSGAHYFGRSLGEEIAPFLIGAYRADITLVHYNPIYRRRKEFAATGVELPFWAAEPVALQFGHETQAAIAGRVHADLQMMGLSPEEMSPTCMPLLWQRSRGKSHFDAASRNYPMYEPFLTRRLCDFALRLPADRLTSPDLPDPERKMAFYEKRLARYSRIPFNPTATPEYAEMVAAIRKGLPRELWPTDIMRAGEWHDYKGPAHEQVIELAAHGRKLVREVCGLKIDRSELVLAQILMAAGRAQGVTSLP